MIDKKKLMRRIINPTDEKHMILFCLKYLYADKKRKYWAIQRNRELNQVYYTIKIKGNWIKLYSTQYLVDGKPCNRFMSSVYALISGDVSEIQRVVINKLFYGAYAFNEFNQFMDDFAALVESDQDSNQVIVSDGVLNESIQS